MKVTSAALAAALAALALPAAADEALAKKHNCFACHTVDKKLVGPSYQEVAKKYKGQKNAAATLEGSVKKGSNGKWGQVPMPPNAVPDDEIKKLVAWILKQG